METVTDRRRIKKSDSITGSNNPNKWWKGYYLKWCQEMLQWDRCEIIVQGITFMYATQLKGVNKIPTSHPIVSTGVRQLVSNYFQCPVSQLLSRWQYFCSSKHAATISHTCDILTVTIYEVLYYHRTPTWPSYWRVITEGLSNTFVMLVYVKFKQSINNCQKSSNLWKKAFLMNDLMGIVCHLGFSFGTIGTHFNDFWLLAT